MNIKRTPDEKKKFIIQILKEKGEVSTGKLSFFTKIHPYELEELLENLNVVDKLIDRVDMPRGVYWKIKSKKEEKNGNKKRD